MQVNVDLHIHSKYSMAVSMDMEFSAIAREASRKGLKIVGSGDCLHPKWLKELKELPLHNDLFALGETYFIPSVEVEDCCRIHHLILLPDVSKAEELREGLFAQSGNLDRDGRPRVHMNGAEIADKVIEAGGLIGPSHAFTPWTGIFAYNKTLKECYQEKAESIDFIELGLSADTDYADRISELADKTFLSNSDAHSPRANKLGREFNSMEMSDFSFADLARSIKRENNLGPALNVGMFPEEGKYNRTACTRCFRQYSMHQMDEFMGRCPECRGQIKIGVVDRVNLLADRSEPIHPSHRPAYMHLIPLAEIIALALGHKSATTAGVQRIYSDLTAAHTEIQVLMQVDLDQINADAKVMEAIRLFRLGKVVVLPGGGGKYGEIRLPATFNAKEESSKGQKSLFEF